MWPCYTNLARKESCGAPRRGRGGARRINLAPDWRLAILGGAFFVCIFRQICTNKLVLITYEDEGGALKPKKSGLTDQELEIMKIVWEREPATVRDVYEELLSARKIAYTTVMTMMGILEKKGHLKRSSSGRAYVYRPAKPKSQVVGGIVQDFVRKVFDGSARPLLVHLAENREISEEEIEEVRRMLRRRKEGKR